MIAGKFNVIDTRFFEGKQLSPKYFNDIHKSNIENINNIININNARYAEQIKIEISSVSPLVRINILIKEAMAYELSINKKAMMSIENNSGDIYYTIRCILERNKKIIINAYKFLIDKITKDIWLNHYSNIQIWQYSSNLIAYFSSHLVWSCGICTQIPFPYINEPFLKQITLKYNLSIDHLKILRLAGVIISENNIYTTMIHEPNKYMYPFISHSKKINYCHQYAHDRLRDLFF